jgi:4-hydroxy-3-polyprenylbenzoate decarboxylase
MKDLREYLDLLKTKNELKIVNVEVDPELEITEIADRIVKTTGKTILFNKVKGSNIPVVINLFGSERHMSYALGVKEAKDIGESLTDLLKIKMPTSILDTLKMLPMIKEIFSYTPKIKNNAPWMDVEEKDLSFLPALKCWPNDGGRYITLPLVITKDPVNGIRNVGMYRLQIYDNKTIGLHWQAHKGGAYHYNQAEKMNKPLEVAIALGADPATIFSAAVPLPEDVDEFLFSGYIRKENVELTKCFTVDIEVPRESEIVIEGIAMPYERKLEGPFGDHNGYYSPPEMFPYMHITSIHRRKDAIYPTTIVGKPIMEDAYIGKAVEQLTMPIIKFIIPEIKDINLPIESVFHNLAIVSIQKRYPGHAKKVAMGLWGLGMLSLTKIIVVLDDDINVHNLKEVLWATTTRIDPQRDVSIINFTPTDTLDHASPLLNYGSKMLIDATKKWKEEGYTRTWPEVISMKKEIVELVSKRWKEYGLDKN